MLPSEPLNLQVGGNRVAVRVWGACTEEEYHQVIHTQLQVWKQAGLQVMHYTYHKDGPEVWISDQDMKQQADQTPHPLIDHLHPDETVVFTLTYPDRHQWGWLWHHPQVSLWSSPEARRASQRSTHTPGNPGGHLFAEYAGCRVAVQVVNAHSEEVYRTTLEYLLTYAGSGWMQVIPVLLDVQGDTCTPAGPLYKTLSEETVRRAFDGHLSSQEVAFHVLPYPEHTRWGLMQGCEVFLTLDATRSALNRQWSTHTHKFPKTSFTSQNNWKNHV